MVYKSGDDKYRQLARDLQGRFPGYQIDDQWLKRAQAGGLNVFNVSDVAHYLSGDDTRALEEARAAAPEYAQQITKDHARTMRAAGIPTNDPARVKEYISSSKNLGLGGGMGRESTSPKFPVPETKYAKPQSQTDLLNNFLKGFNQGMDYGSSTTRTLMFDDDTGQLLNADADRVSNFPGYGKSFLTERAPEAYHKGLDPAGKAGFVTGRAAADITGHGTRKHLWNLHPLDIAWTAGTLAARRAGYSSGAARGIGFLTQEAVGLGSGNYDLTNLGEGGRPKGFAAISADKDDPRVSTNPGLDLVGHRHFLGRTGKLLPWEQFKQERPDVRQEDYQEYRDWIVGADPDPIGQGTLGLIKVDTNPITGLDLRVLGYHLSPLGVASGVGTALALTHPKTRGFLAKQWDTLKGANQS